METTEIKSLLFKKIDSLDKNKLQEVYGILVNSLNEQKKISDWVVLSDQQQQGVLDAIAEIDSGKGVSHERVISKVRKKYSHA